MSVHWWAQWEDRAAPSHFELSNYNVAQLKRCNLQDIETSSYQKIEPSVRIVGLVFGQRQTMSRQIFHCYHSDPVASATSAEIKDEDHGPPGSRQIEH